jgi:hypothetical protein
MSSLAVGSILAASYKIINAIASGLCCFLCFSRSRGVCKLRIDIVMSALVSAAVITTA